jgi:hypothetical protein
MTAMSNHYPAQPGYAPPPPRGKSIASMILGIAAIFFGFTFVVPIVGLVLGIIGVRSEPAGHGMAIAGIIMNALMLVGWVIAAVVVIIVLIGSLGTLATIGVTSSY